MHYPNFETFRTLAKKGNLIPVSREILADTETPVSALIKFRSNPFIFLLESVEGGEKWGRYTFIGTEPRAVFQVKGDDISISENGATTKLKHNGDPLGQLEKLMGSYRPAPVESLPRFYGGAVGFMGYDMVRYFERLPGGPSEETEMDTAVFLVTDTLLIFDNVRHTIRVVSCAVTEGINCNDHEGLRSVYEEAVRKIESTIARLKCPAERNEQLSNGSPDFPLQTNMEKDEFTAMVEKGKEYIMAGDIIQVVLSQRFEVSSGVDPMNVYRALRFVNPSPYLFFLKFEDLFLVGSSPEVMVRLEEGVAELRPIAGTRRRGRTEQEDRSLADELLNDPKERAEHVMLVDLGRNDLGRIAAIGSVQVNQLMAVERYSHVMHLVSNIQAQLAPGNDAFDVLRAAFPAGTLTGAPKIRAMQIIDELEPSRRGPYGGAVGYFSFSGNMDFCITIRTFVIRDGRIYIQAGAGIVADSNPEMEYRETLGKAEALVQALRMAGAGFEIPARTN